MSSDLSETSSDDGEGGPTLVERLTRFLRDRYRDEVFELAKGYPRDNRTLEVEYDDLWAFDPSFADDYLTSHDAASEYLHEALRNFDNPVDCSFTSEEYGDAVVRVVGLPDEHVYGVGELRDEQRGRFVGIRGQINRVSAVDSYAAEIAYECQRCGTTTRIPQNYMAAQDPHECSGCERQGPFTIDFEASHVENLVCLQLKQPPEESASGSGAGQTVDVFVEGDLIGVEPGENIPANHAGERAIVYGMNRYDQWDFDARNDSPVFGSYVEANAISYEQRSASDVEIETYREEVTEYARGEHGDPVEAFAGSVAPDIEADAEFEEVLEGVVLYLFAGWRKEPSDSSPKRGDIHLLLVGDPGVAKSVVASRVGKIAPIAEKATGNDLTSAGLTCAAVRDGFMNDQWTLDPGILPKANGGRAIIDELDKADDTVSRSMHDALEGDQQVEVAKAGINATLNTRAGLFAAGNPEYGRFDPTLTVTSQIDLDPALVSRFDLIFTLTDDVDIDHDTNVAEHIGNSWLEAAAATLESVEFGDSSVDVDVDAEIPLPALSAWVALGQEKQPTFDPEGEALDVLTDFYVSTRQANNDLAPAENPSDGDDAVPVTALTLEAGFRLAEASARCRLSDVVEKQDAERAVRLSKRSMGDTNWDAETGVFDADRRETSTPKSQRDRIQGVKDAVNELEGDDPAELDEVLDLCEETGMDRSMAEHELGKLRRRGELYTPDGPESLRTT